MITLYHCDAARSFRPLWMLEELNLTYELKMLPFPPRVLAKDYLALNRRLRDPFASHASNGAARVTRFLSMTSVRRSIPCCGTRRTKRCRQHAEVHERRTDIAGLVAPN
jgi:hypothetical protein